VHKATTDLTRKRGPSLWKPQDPVDGRVDFEIELLSETALTCLVVLEGITELLVRFWVE